MFFVLNGVDSPCPVLQTQVLVFVLDSKVLVLVLVLVSQVLDLVMVLVTKVLVNVTGWVIGAGTIEALRRVPHLNLAP